MEPKTDYKAGDLLGERYQLLREIGQGGMGKVYKARDTSRRNRIVAIKVLTGDNLELSLLRRFVEEAEALSEAGHPHIVTFFEAVLSPDQPPFIVMEYLQGEDLAKRVGRDVLAVDYAVDTLLSLCSAISFCHSRGIVHRDLKPENVFLHRPEPHIEIPKLIDFGVSKSAFLQPDVTGHGLPGTPRYMSPEQVSGRGASMLSDQYALALLLHVLLTRTKPFALVPVEQLSHAIEHGQISHAKALREDVPDELDAVIARAMNVDPSKRFASVDEFAKHLLPFASPLGKHRWNDRFTKAPAEGEGAQLTGPSPIVAMPLPRSQVGGTTANELNISTVRQTGQTAATVAAPGKRSGAGDGTSSTAFEQHETSSPEVQISNFRAASGPTPSAPPVTLEGDNGQAPRRRVKAGAKGAVILLTAAAAVGAFLFGQPRTNEPLDASKVPAAIPPPLEPQAPVLPDPTAGAAPPQPSVPAAELEPLEVPPPAVTPEPTAKAAVAAPGPRKPRPKTPPKAKARTSVQANPQPQKTRASTEEPVEYRDGSPILR